MKIRRCITVALLLAPVGYGVAQYKADTNIYARDDQELRKIERQWTEAMEREDATRLEKILGDEYTMIDSVGVAANRAEVLDRLRSGALKFDSFATSDIKSRIFQGGAVLTGRLIAKGKYKEQDITGDYRFVDVFEYRNGAWKAVYTQLSKLKAEK